MTYKAKQGLQAAVAKQRRMLKNDVIFKKKEEDDCLRKVSFK